MATQWYYMKAEQRLGPVLSKELRSLAKTGQLKPNDLVWKDGLDDWVPAEKIKGLFTDAASGSATSSATPPPVNATTPVNDEINKNGTHEEFDFEAKRSIVEWLILACWPQGFRIRYPRWVWILIYFNFLAVFGFLVLFFVAFFLGYVE